MLKFSGGVTVDSGGVSVDSFLADGGFGASPVVIPLSYPVAVAHSLRNMATNVFISAIAPPTGTILIRLLRNGAPVPGFSTAYGVGEGGVKSVLAGPEAYAIGDTFDLEVTTSGFTVGVGIDVTATVGVE